MYAKHGKQLFYWTTPSFRPFTDAVLSSNGTTSYTETSLDEEAWKIRLREVRPNHMSMTTRTSVEKHTDPRLVLQMLKKTTT